MMNIAGFHCGHAIVKKVTDKNMKKRRERKCVK